MSSIQLKYGHRGIVEQHVDSAERADGEIDQR